MSCSCTAAMPSPQTEPGQLLLWPTFVNGRDTLAPASIPNLTNWWSSRPGYVWQERDGSRATLATAAGNPVGEIAQLYGSYPLSAGSDSVRPTIKKAFRSAAFDGTNDLLGNASVAGRGTSWTLAWSGRVGAHDGNYRILCQLGAFSSGQGFTIHIQPTTGELNCHTVGGSGLSITAAPAADEHLVLIVTYDGTTKKVYKNGVLIDSIAMTANLLGGFYLGSFSDTSYPSASFFRDAVVYSRPLNGAERRVLTDYLKS